MRSVDSVDTAALSGTYLPPPQGLQLGSDGELLQPRRLCPAPSQDPTPWVPLFLYFHCCPSASRQGSNWTGLRKGSQLPEITASLLQNLSPWLVNFSGPRDSNLPAEPCSPAPSLALLPSPKHQLSTLQLNLTPHNDCLAPGIFLMFEN